MVWRYLICALTVVLLLPSLSYAARGFGATHGTATTDKIDTQLTSLTTQTSWSIWAQRKGSGGGAFGRMWDKDSGTTGRRVLFYNNSTSTYNMAVSWSGGVAEWTIAAPSADVWHHIIVTYDGGSISNNPIIYVDGSSVTVTTLSAGVGTLQTNTGPYLIGNRADNIRNWDGYLGEFAVWDGILTSGNVTSLYNAGAGARADSIGPPTDYWQVCGTASPEPNEIGGRTTGTVTGALLQTHPISTCTASVGGSSIMLLGVGR